MRPCKRTGLLSPIFFITRNGLLGAASKFLYNPTVNGPPLLTIDRRRKLGEGRYGAERDQHHQPTVRLTGHLCADALADSAYKFTQDMISSPGSARPHSDSAGDPVQSRRPIR